MIIMAYGEEILVKYKKKLCCWLKQEPCDFNSEEKSVLAGAV